MHGKNTIDPLRYDCIPKFAKEAVRELKDRVEDHVELRDKLDPDDKLFFKLTDKLSLNAQKNKPEDRRGAIADAVSQMEADDTAWHRAVEEYRYNWKEEIPLSVPGPEIELPEIGLEFPVNLPELEIKLPGTEPEVSVWKKAVKKEDEIIRSDGFPGNEITGKISPEEARYRDGINRYLYNTDKPTIDWTAQDKIIKKEDPPLDDWARGMAEYRARWD